MILLFIVGVPLMFFTYYLAFGARKSTFIGGKGATLRNIIRIISSNIDIYRPTPWIFGGHLQTLYTAAMPHIFKLMPRIFKSMPRIKYVSEYIDTPDGGVLKLDWSPGGKQGTEEDSEDIVLILPGLTGNSEENYALNFVEIAKKLGYRAVVMNYRGSGSPLMTYRTCCAANTDDLEVVLRHLNERRPTSRVCVVGVSLGGIIMAHYLIKMGSSNQKSLVLAAFGVSIPWDLFVARRSLEKPLSWLLFNLYLTRKLQRMFKNNVTALKARGIEVPKNVEEPAMKANTIREFDEAVVAPMFGYRDVDDYHSAASVSKQTFEYIKTPLLCLNAADDPFSPREQLPVQRIENCDNVAMVLTDTGGHVGFLEGFLPTGRSYMNSVYKEYVKTVFETL